MVAVPTSSIARRGLGRIPHIVDIRLLGSVEAVDEQGVGIDLGGPQPRALVALLARHMPDVVTNETIAETFWPDREDSGIDSAIHVVVNRVRRALSKEIIETAGGGYRLNIPPTNLDVTRFRLHAKRGRQLFTLGHPRKATESLRQALAQWNGPAVADLRKLDFAERWAAQLDEERIAVVEDLLEAELQCGEHDLVVGELFGLVDTYPLRERLWRLLMLALYRAGRQAEALRAYARLRDTLAEELGVEPSPDLMDLEERVLLHDPALMDVADPDPSTWPEDQEHVTFAPGHVIVEEGTAADVVYWIEDGIVAVDRRDDDGRVVRLAELGPGRYFGELASLLDTKRTATATAMTAVTVTVHNRDSFRRRLGAERARREVEADPARDLWDLVRRGQYLEAYDKGMSLVDAGVSDPEIRYVAVLALARSGATVQARRRFRTLGLDSIDPQSVSADLGRDLAALAARLEKDMALTTEGDISKGWARRSAENVWQRQSEVFPHRISPPTRPRCGCSPATSNALGNVAVEALDLLEAEVVPEGHGAYWHHVTEAEAAPRPWRAGSSRGGAGRRSGGVGHRLRLAGNHDQTTTFGVCGDRL